MLSDGNNLLAWNISNPKYHPYFSYGSTFKDSHLYIEKPYNERGLMHYMLRKKIDSQLKTITNNFVDQKFPIQVIIEGFESFYNCLERRLTGLSYQIIRDKPEDKNTLYNISGIIVDTSVYHVLHEQIMQIEYDATEDNNKKKTTFYPCVELKNISTGNHLIIIAAHVNGCSSQFPEEGLHSLRTLMESLGQSFGYEDIIAIGDFNSPPDYVAKVFDGKFKIVTTNYLTHCNPNSQACKYDMAVVLPGSKQTNGHNYEMLPVEYISINSQNLVNSIGEAQSAILQEKELIRMDHEELLEILYGEKK